MDYLQDNQIGPKFTPCFVTDHDINYGQVDDLAFTKKPVEIAIDDFFNFDDQIVFDNRENPVQYHMPSSKKLENERKSKLIKDAHDRRNQINSKKKKDTKTNPYDRHETGWDNRANPHGKFFDPNLKKREIFPYKNKKLTQNHCNHINLQQNDEVELDYDYAQKFLETKSKEMLKKEKNINEQKIGQLESLLNAEKERTKVQEQEFENKYNNLLQMQKDVQHRADFGKKRNNNSTKKVNQRPSSTKKTSKKTQKKKVRPSTSNYIMDTDCKHNVISDEPFIGYDNDDIPFYDRLEYLKERTKEQLPEYRTSSRDKSPNICIPRNSSQSYEKQIYKTPKYDPTESQNPYYREHLQTDVPTRQKPILQDEKRVQFAPNHTKCSREKKHTLKKLDVLNSQLNALKSELNPECTVPKDDKKWYINCPHTKSSKTGYKSKGPMENLVEKSTGRLLKVHNDKLITLLVDDLLLEIVAILNEKEAIDRQAINEQEVKKYAELMLEELYGMNSIQNDVEKAVYKAKDVFNITSNEVENLKYGKHSLDLNYPKTFADNLHTNSISNQIPEFDSERFKKEILVTNYLKGPLKTTHTAEDYNKKYPNFSDNELIKLIRDKVDLERYYQKINHFNPSYVQAVSNVGEQIISEIYEEVYGECDEMINGFVSGVIKSEFE